MPSTLTVSRCPQSISVRPPPVPRARTTTLGRPGVASSTSASSPASPAHATTTAAASRSPAPPGTSDGFTESAATRAWRRARRASRTARILPGPVVRRGARLLGQPEPVRDGGRLRAAAHVELGKDPRDVDARGLLGHVELSADLAVRRAAGDKREHLALARREAERVAGPRGLLHGRGPVAVAVKSQAGAGDEALDLAGEPGGAESARDLDRLAGGRGSGVAVVGGDVRLGLAP